MHPHTPHTAHTRHADTPRGPCVQCAHRVERDERCAELITNKRTELPGGVGSPVHTYHSHGLTQTIRRQRPGRVKGVLSPAAMACGRWHATWLGCLAHASAAASRSRVQASPATALGVYQRAMSSLARAPRAAASPGCSSTVRMARRMVRRMGTRVHHEQREFTRAVLRAARERPEDDERRRYLRTWGALRRARLDRRRSRRRARGGRAGG